MPRNFKDDFKPITNKKYSKPKAPKPPKKTKKKIAKTPKKGKRKFFSFILRLLLILIILLVLVKVIIFIYYFKRALAYDIENIGKMPERSQVFDKNGVLIGRIDGANRQYVKFERISPHFFQALLAREDKRFYKHFGFDPIGIARAALQNLKRRHTAQGGSTITMQLSRNSFNLFEDSLDRKLLELCISLRVEHKFSKQEILELYANRIFFGGNIYGVERASQVYFNKKASELSLAEAATLVGMIRSPNNISPLKSPKAALENRNQTLLRMLIEKVIDTKEYEQEKNLPLFHSPESQPANKINSSNKFKPLFPQNSYILDAVNRELDQILMQTESENGGLIIETTIDSKLQKQAKIFLEEHLQKIENLSQFQHKKRAQVLSSKKITANKDDAEQLDYLQGAAFAIDPLSGAVRVIIGGRNFTESPFNRALYAKRQIGSVFKPFVYAAAYDNGLLPGTLINDNALAKSENFIISNPWSPENSDRKYLGMQAAELGLYKSRNTMAVRVGQSVGINKIRSLTKDAGFEAELPSSPVTYIGTFEATLKEAVAAYSAFFNEGEKKNAYIIEKISLKSNPQEILYQRKRVGKKIFSREAAFLTAMNLCRVIEIGTAASAKNLGLRVKAAGKTGTSDGYKDAWFVGGTRGLVAGVWTGFDKPKKIMSRAYGSRLALPIWVKILNASANLDYQHNLPWPPSASRKVELCRLSGKLAGDICRRRKFSYQFELPESIIPTQICRSHPQAKGNSRQPQRRNQGKQRGFWDAVRGFFNNF